MLPVFHPPLTLPQSMYAPPSGRLAWLHTGDYLVQAAPAIAYTTAILLITSCCNMEDLIRMDDEGQSKS